MSYEPNNSELSFKALEALNQAALLIASEISLDKVLQHIVGAAQSLLSAEYVALAVPNADGTLDAFVHTGFSAETQQQLPDHPAHSGLLGDVLNSPHPVRIQSIKNDPRHTTFPKHHPDMTSFLGIPIKAGTNILGNLYLSNKTSGSFFSNDDQQLAEMLAAHAAIAIHKARLYEKIQQLAVLEERNRIGMDLHDGVIQSIYGVGLTVDSLQMLVEDNSEAVQLLSAISRNLDTTIQDIRNFIMDLRPRHFQGNLSHGIQQIVREFQANTNIPVTLEIVSDTSSIPTAIARTIFLTIQEALANVARHASADSVIICLKDKGTSLKLTIEDDGCGFDITQRKHQVGHGLANMRTRAHTLSGSFQLASTPGQGTLITLNLPCKRLQATKA